jgi:hypothetical protein
MPMTDPRTADERYLERWEADSLGEFWSSAQLRAALRAAELRPETRLVIETRAAIRVALDKLEGDA